MAHIVAKTTGNAPDAAGYTISCTVNNTADRTATRTASTVWLSPKEPGLRAAAVLNRGRRRSGSTHTTRSHTRYYNHLQTGCSDGHMCSRRDLKHSCRPSMTAGPGQAQQAREGHTHVKWWR
jgi:hypothetical protein